MLLKKIFGSQQSKDILISFLNAIIYNGEKIIKDLRIVNPFNPGKIISLKETYLDIKAVLVSDRPWSDMLSLSQILRCEIVIFWYISGWYR